MASEVHPDHDKLENASTDSNITWDRYLGLEDILSSYDTVVEIYSDSPTLNPGSEYLDRNNAVYHGLNEELLQPGWDYESKSDGIELISERLDGDSIVVAFGFDGEELPNYDQISELDSRGNWWDHPERLPADMLVDDQTYTGALKPPRESSVSHHTFRNGSDLRDVHRIR